MRRLQHWQNRQTDGAPSTLEKTSMPSTFKIGGKVSVGGTDLGSDRIMPAPIRHRRLRQRG